MRKIYLLVQNDIRTGPFTIKELLQHSLHTESLIWVIGESEDWLSPIEIPSLKVYFIIKEDGSLTLDQDAVKELETVSLEGGSFLPKEPSNNFLGAKPIQEVQADTQEKNREANNRRAASVEINTATQKSSEGQERIRDNLKSIREEDSYGLGKNKWPVLATITLMVLLIIWSILFNDNDRQKTSIAYTTPAPNTAILPAVETNKETEPSLIEEENETATTAIMPIVVPSNVSHTESSSSTSTTKSFLDSVGRVLDSQDQLMAEVDAVYKKSFSYPKRSYSPRAVNNKSLYSSALNARTTLKDKKPVRSSSVPVHQQVDLQSRFIRNGNKQNLSGVEVMVKNNSQQVLKSISVDVFYYKRGEHLLEKETVYFSNVYPRQSLTMSIAGNQKATSARMQLGAITLAERR